jgi:hypothetical protein
MNTRLALESVEASSLEEGDVVVFRLGDQSIEAMVLKIWALPGDSRCLLLNREEDNARVVFADEEKIARVS